MQRVYSAEQMRAVDRMAIDEIGIPGPVLMENAARGILGVLHEVFGPVAGKRIVIACGPGNNGGDGYAVARYLRDLGAAVDLYSAADLDRPRGDAKLQIDVLSSLGVPIHVLSSQNARAELARALQGADLAVDALLGTGVEKTLGGRVLDAVLALNSSAVPVLSVDLPTGIHSGTGAVLGTAVRAAATACLCAPKLGNLHHPGRQHAGRLFVVPIGIPSEVQERVDASARLLSRAEDAAHLLPARDRAGHKGTYGHVALFAGSPARSGASLLAGVSALRGGAGLVTLFTDAETQRRLEGQVPELMVAAVADAAEQPVGAEAIQAIGRGKGAIVAGPGLAPAPAVRGLVRGLAAVECPVVLDAEALNALAVEPTLAGGPPLILTPHPGEAARLLSCSSAQIQEDRASAAHSLATRYNATVVLKGAAPVVVTPDGETRIVLGGHAGMATAGSGDVLAGLLGAVVSQFGPSLDNVAAAVWLHACAGRIAAAQRGGAVHAAGLMAGDIAAAIPAAWNQLERARESPSTPSDAGLFRPSELP